MSVLEQELLEHFAAFVKASFIYPANNERVTTSCDELKAVFEKLPQEKEYGHSITIEGDAFRVSGIPIEAENATARWLHDSFMKARIGGVEVSGNVALDALHEFAEKLRQSFARLDSKEISMWDVEIEGGAAGRAALLRSSRPGRRARRRAHRVPRAPPRRGDPQPP